MPVTTDLYNIGVYLPEREKAILDRYAKEKELTWSSAVIQIIRERAIAQSLDPKLFKQVERMLREDDQIKKLSKRRSKKDVGK